MPYCMYLRKSRADIDAETRGDGETLARHEQALKELAIRLGIAIDGVYREIVSGDTIASRPEMQRLLLGRVPKLSILRLKNRSTRLRHL